MRLGEKKEWGVLMHPLFPYITVQVLKRSLFFAALGLIGVVIAWLIDRANFAASAVIFGLGIYCFASAFLPFQIYIADGVKSGRQVPLRLFALLEVSVLVVVAYVLTIWTIWHFDRPIFGWLSSSRHFYLAYPACVFAFIVLLMTITTIFSEMRKTKGG